MIEQYGILCAAGALGQAVRVIGGLKKACQDKEEIDGARVIESLLMGFFTGGSVGIFTGNAEMAFLSGYAGTDFLEAMIHKKTA